MARNEKRVFRARLSDDPDCDYFMSKAFHSEKELVDYVDSNYGASAEFVVTRDVAVYSSKRTRKAV